MKLVEVVVVIMIMIIIITIILFQLKMHLLFFTILLHVITQTHGHGRLVDPPGRSTMWRYGFNTPVNTNDHQLSCGGFGVRILYTAAFWSLKLEFKYSYILLTSPPYFVIPSGKSLLSFKTFHLRLERKEFLT